MHLQIITFLSVLTRFICVLKHDVYIIFNNHNSGRFRDVGVYRFEGGYHPDPWNVLLRNVCKTIDSSFYHDFKDYVSYLLNTVITVVQ